MRFGKLLLLLAFLSVGCSSISEYGTDEIYMGEYGSAWRGDALYIYKAGDAKKGAMHDLVDLVAKPAELAVNTVTLRFWWGTNGISNYLCGLLSILPGYSHCDAAFWYDYGILSYDFGTPDSDTGKSSQ